jgi:hypothetical protein
MSFGKRPQPGPRNSGRSGGATRFEAPLPAAVFAGFARLPKWQRQLLVFAGFVLGAFILPLIIRPIVAAAIVATASGTVTSLNPSEAKRLVFDLPVYQVAPAEAELNETLRKACIEPWRAARGDWRQPQAEFQEIDPGSGRITHDFSSGSAVLTCLMNHQRHRFCMPSQRKQIVSLLQQFIRVRRADAARFAALPAYAKPFEMIVHDLDGRDPNGINASRSPAQHIDTDLIRALQDLARDGYLKPADFGGPVPAEFAPFIVNTRTESCKP